MQKLAPKITTKINLEWYNKCRRIAKMEDFDIENFGILYFSSTGNSLYIAKRIKSKLGGKVLYIPTYTGDGSEFKKIIIVTPIYSFGLPVPLLDLLDKLNKTSEIIVIQNYGGMVGGADRLFYEYTKKRALNIKSVFVMKMPENYTLVMSPPNFYKNAVLRTADKKIAEIIQKIKDQNYRIPKKKSTKEKTYLKNKANWHKIGERFSVSDKCIKCGKCIQMCPAKNISMENSKIKFSNKCIACLGCFHRCPQKAIIYNNKDNKKRYLNPNIEENEIGKNIE